MTKHLMAWFLSRLADPSLALKQIEAYEGQFEDPEDISVFPPAAMIAITRLASESQMPSPDITYSVSIYLVTNHVHGTSSDAMLDLIDGVIAAIHNAPVRYSSAPAPTIPPDKYFGRAFFTDGDFLGIMPGLAVYRLNFTIRS